LTKTYPFHTYRTYGAYIKDEGVYCGGGSGGGGTYWDGGNVYCSDSGGEGA